MDSLSPYATPLQTVEFLPETVERNPLPALNHAVWSSLFKSRNAVRRRDRKRLEFSIAAEFQRLKLSDGNVVELLGTLATDAPTTAVSRSVRRLCQQLTSTKTQILDRDLLVELLSIKVDPSNYSDPNRYFWDNQLVKFLSKYPFKGYDIGAELNALESFLECERKNALTNKTWKELAPSDEIEVVLARLHDILGVVPLDEEVISRGGWGPGTVMGYTYDRLHTGPEFKFAGMPTLTPSLIPVAGRVVDSIPSWSSWLTALRGRHERFSLVPGSKFFTVPKKFLMARSACSEPQLNVFLQLGVGRIMRDRLEASDDVNLRREQFRNQELAYIGSVTDIYCTVDLENASNNVCRGPLISVLPRDWYDLLVTIASSVGLLPDGPPINGEEQTYTWHTFHMLSSMGNGFTFELETILFRAIITSIVPGKWVWVSGKQVLCWPHVCVFGDDLIFPRAYFHKVVDVLSLFGFTVNKAKTFTSGPFRESCGMDYFLGVPVRPLYVTKRLDNGESIVSLSNRLLHFAFEGPTSGGNNSRIGDSRWRGAWTRLVLSIPSSLRQLIQTTPGVPSGLWGLGESIGDSVSGKPFHWTVIRSSPVKVLLSSCPALDHHLDEDHDLKLDGNNTMAARLSQIGSEVTQPTDWGADPCMVSSGDFATLRQTVTYKVTSSLQQVWRRWLSWS